MDILDGFSAGPEENIDLESLVLTEAPVVKPPAGSVRNRAATTALLAKDPSKAIENYQAMVAEGEQGKNNIQSEISNQYAQENEQTDMHGVMTILSDPGIPIEQKQRILGSIKQSQFLKDSGNTLLTNGLAAGSAGENEEQESARITAADAISEIYQSRNAVQGLVNAHGASLDSASATTVGEMVEQWVMPFGNSINSGKLLNAYKSKSGTPLSLWDRIKSYVLPGTATATLRDELSSVPPSQRAEVAKSLIDTISNNSGILFSNDNQFAQFDKARSIFEEGGYGDFEEFVDNISPLLDAIGVGQVLRGGKKAVSAGKGAKGARIDPTMPSTPGTSLTEIVQPATWELVDDSVKGIPIPESHRIGDQVARIEYNGTVRLENPAAPAKIIQQANPEQARSLHSAVVHSEGDEVAEGLYGTTKQDAIVSDVFPQATTPNGAVTTRVQDIQRNLKSELEIPDELVDMVHNVGGIELTRAEKAAARAHVVNDFETAGGMTINDAMSSFTVDGRRIKISAVYGTPEGGFLKPEAAVAQAQLALRSYGIRPDEIILMRKDGLDHIPVKLEDVYGKDGNYYVKIDTFHDIDPTDAGKLETFNVKRNLFDRISPWINHVVTDPARWLFDASSMLHPTYTAAGSVATDLTSRFEKYLLDVASQYSDKWKKLPPDRRNLVNDYIKEANFNGIKFDTTDLIARGFSADEISALESWRRFWDSHFYLENYDVVRSLNAQGYQLFKDATTELYARPLSKNTTLGGSLDASGQRVVGGTKMYNPSSGLVTILTKDEIDQLYAANGTVAKLRRVTDFGGIQAEYMIVRNTPTQYLRKFRDSDQVLNYRDGYFQIQYKAPRFVDEIVRDSQGAITSRRAIAVAGDTSEAEVFASRMRSSNVGKDYLVRGDDRALQRGSDDWWDVESAGGRIAQRYRGKLLEDGSGMNHLGSDNYILNPVDSAQRAARSIAGRTVTRPMLETAKARFLQQYSQYLPSNGMGGVKYPNSLNEIGAKGTFTTSELADARTTYQYISYLENGYINGTDRAVKALLNVTAEMLGKVGASKLERGANTLAEGGGGPLSLSRNLVFQAYIAMNPLRQLIVQPHQAVRTFSYNPIGWANGKIESFMAGYLSEKMGLATTGHGISSLSQETKDFVKFIDNSGLMDSVDKQNLVRGSLRDAADSTNVVARQLGKGAAIPRKYGFDIGEMSNLLIHAAAVYERHKRLGKNLLDKVDRDEAYSEIRAISYDMNFAGDMPYNQTTPSVILQFMQVPHKAFLQATNRRIDPGIRARMILTDVALWGGPTLMVSELLGADILPDNDKLREVFLWGMESMLLNNMFSYFSDTDTKIDFSSLAPYDITGWAKVMTELYSGGLQQMVLNSPAGQMFMKEGGRGSNAISAMSRYFAGFTDEDELPETFLGVMNEVAKMTSGYSNGFKAYQMLEAKKRLDQYGSRIDNSTTHLEAWAQLFGFGTADARDLYRLSQEFSKDTKAHREETMRVYNDIKRYYAEKLQVESTDPKFITAVSGRILKTFENDPVAKEMIAKQLRIDLQGKDQQLLYQFMKRSGIPDPDNLRDQIKRMPVDDAQKQLMLKRLDDVQKARNNMKKE